MVQRSEICSGIISLSNNIGGDGFDNIQTADIDDLMLNGPIDDDDLIEIMTINENKDVDIGKDEGEGQDFFIAKPRRRGYPL